MCGLEIVKFIMYKCVTQVMGLDIINLFSSVYLLFLKEHNFILFII